MKVADKHPTKKAASHPAPAAAKSAPGKKAPAAPTPKAAPAPKAAKVVTAKAGAKGHSAPASAHPAAAAGKTAHPASSAKAAAPALAAKPAPAAKPAKAAKKGRGKKAEEAPRERMAGPSIRISYDANGDAVCREVACEGLSTANGYCRMHYIKNWKKIKRKEVILKEGKLNQYIEELVNKYPDKYIEAIREDLANDKDFAKVIYDLDLDESVDDFEGEGENLEGIVGDIKRDFEGDDDSGF